MAQDPVNPGALPQQCVHFLPALSLGGAATQDPEEELSVKSMASDKNLAPSCLNAQPTWALLGSNLFQA